MNLYKFHSKPKSLDLHDYMHHEDGFFKLFWKAHGTGDFNLAKITTSAQYSYQYARHTNAPFKLGEAAIATDAECSLKYALYILQGPFKLGESTIAKNGDYSFEYARFVLKKRFKAGEPAIAKDCTLSLYYATDVIGGRFKAGEAAIAKNDDCQDTYDEFIHGNDDFDDDDDEGEGRYGFLGEDF